MKILVLTKRHSMGKDLIKERFGAPINLFKHLSNKHEIEILCWDRKKNENFDCYIEGISVKVRSFLYFLLEAIKLGRDLSYDKVVAMMCPLTSFIGYFTTKNTNKRFVYFMQDNYESYPETYLPFFKTMHRVIINKSYKRICVSHTLSKRIGKKTYVIENGVDLDKFSKTNKAISRKKLHLPKEDILVLYTGTTFKHDINTLIKAFKIVKTKLKNTKLVLVGNFKEELPKENTIIEIGIVSHDKIPLYLSSADVLVLPYGANKTFDLGSFPAKLPEYMAVNVPIVASALNNIKQAFEKKDQKKALYEPRNAEDMAKKIIANIGKKVDYRETAKKYSWVNLAKRLEKILK